MEKNKALDEEVYHLKDVIKDLKKSLNEQYDKLQNNDLIAKNNDRKHEHILNEARKRNQSLEEKAQHFEKQIVSVVQCIPHPTKVNQFTETFLFCFWFSQSELTVELEAERKNRQTKQNALQLTTEEISRANSIIGIQVKELNQLKKKVEMRTDIALQQEKAVKMLEQENETLRNKLKEVFMNSDNQKDVSKRLEELRVGTDELEQKYSKSKWKDDVGMLTSLLSLQPGRFSWGLTRSFFLKFFSLTEIAELNNRLVQVTCDSNLSKTSSRY